MFYGEEKALEMARSILPSRAQKYARREKRQRNKRVRQRWRQALRTAHIEWDPAYDLWWEGDVLEAEIHEEGGWVVYLDEEKTHGEPPKGWYKRERQDADHLNHFERWARIVVRRKGLSGHDARAYMRKLLPKGVIGQHALEHLERYDEFREGEHETSWEEFKREMREINARNKALGPQWARWAKKLRSLMQEDPDTHRKLNHIIKREVGPVRLLQGEHDIEDFCREAWELGVYSSERCEPFTETRVLQAGFKPGAHTYTISEEKQWRKSPKYCPELRTLIEGFLKEGD